MNQLAEDATVMWEGTAAYLRSPELYVQIGIVGATVLFAWALTDLLSTRVKWLRQPPSAGTARAPPHTPRKMQSAAIPGGKIFISGIWR